MYMYIYANQVSKLHSQFRNYELRFRFFCLVCFLGGNHKEDITTGTSAALAGGYTMVCAIPNTNPAVINEESLKLVENLYEQKAVCDYGIYLGASAGKF